MPTSQYHRQRAERSLQRGIGALVAVAIAVALHHAAEVLGTVAGALG